MTLQSLQTFGVPVSSIPNGYFVAGGSRYHSPGNISIEGDWSNAAFFLTAAMFGHAVAVTGLSEASLQGDRAIAPLLARLSDGQSDRVIDVSGIPDLVPILAVAACGVPGTTVPTNAARLRLKESDRLRTTSAMLTSLGAQVKEAEDSLTIFGGVPLHGGETDRLRRPPHCHGGGNRFPSVPWERYYPARRSGEQVLPGFLSNFETVGRDLHVL